MKIYSIVWATGISNTKELDSMVHAHLFDGKVDKTLCGKTIGVKYLANIDMNIWDVECKTCLKSIKAMEKKHEST